MEDYLQNLKFLRSQMNEIEEAAAKRSIEEMNLKTSIETLEKDLLSVKSETTRLNAESGEMEKDRAQICYKILEKQKKISTVEIETSSLLQSMELIGQEKVGASARLEEKRSAYTKIMEELVSKLQQGHEWLDSYKQQMETLKLANERSSKHLNHLGDPPSHNESTSNEANTENAQQMSGRFGELMAQLASKKSSCKELNARESQLDEENIKPALKALDIEALEKELEALLADKAGEMEYLKSLEDQIKQIKSVSHAVKCQCGEEFHVQQIY